MPRHACGWLARRLVHPRATKSKSSPAVHLARFRAASLFARCCHCASRPLLICDRRSFVTAWAEKYPASAADSRGRRTSCRGCAPGPPWRVCTLDPDPANRSAHCGGFTHYNFGPQHNLTVRFGPSVSDGTWARARLDNRSWPFGGAPMALGLARLGE